MRKWTTIVKYVDLETGKELVKSQWADFRVIRKIRLTKIQNYVNNQTKDGQLKGIIYITNECRRIAKQGKLWD